MESEYCHLIYLRRKLLLLADSRWNLFHVEPDWSMPRNNLAERDDIRCVSILIVFRLVYYMIKGRAI